MPDNEHKFIMHKGKEILYIDYRDLTTETFFDEIKKAHSFILHSNKKDILQLVDISASFGDSKVMEEMKRTAVESKPFIKKRAIVGVTGVKKILLTAMNAFTHEKITPFATVEEAKDYLVSD